MPLFKLINGNIPSGDPVAGLQLDAEAGVRNVDHNPSRAIPGMRHFNAVRATG